MANEQTDENGSDLNLTPVPDFDLAGVSLMKRIRESDVFFYPACEFDWSPMLEYTHRCNLFIYCDWGVVSERSKPASKERMKTSHFEGRIALSAADAAQRRDESTQRELATFDNGFGGAWLVPPAHCA